MLYFCTIKYYVSYNTQFYLSEITINLKCLKENIFG